jgi:hypothetical protein
MNTSFSFQPLSSAKVNTESGSRPVGPSQPLALVLNRLEYSLTFAYRVKSKLLIGPIFGGAYSLNTRNNNYYNPELSLILEDCTKKVKGKPKNPLFHRYSYSCHPKNFG